MAFQIGDDVWWARYDSSPSTVTCPDCAGKGHITCIMGGGTEVTVDCQRCQQGFEPFSRGTLTVYDRKPLVMLTYIIGVEMTEKETKYRVPESYIVDEASLFTDKQSAEQYAETLAVAATEAEMAKIQQKEKDTRSWAWNATYHRRCIRDAQRQIEYHTRKLNVAQERAKTARKTQPKERA